MLAVAKVIRRLINAVCWIAAGTSLLLVLVSCVLALMPSPVTISGRDFMRRQVTRTSRDGEIVFRTRGKGRGFFWESEDGSGFAFTIPAEGGRTLVRVHLGHVAFHFVRVIMPEAYERVPVRMEFRRFHGLLDFDIVVMPLTKAQYASTALTSVFSVYAALWPPMLLATIPSLQIVARIVWRRRRRARGRCESCGYILTGLTEPRCPECGRPFRRPTIGTAA